MTPQQSGRATTSKGQTVPTKETNATSRSLRRSSAPAAAIIVLASVLGGLGGLVLGSASDQEFEVQESVQIDQILAFPSWEANSQTARFSQTLQRSDLQSVAQSNSGLDGGFDRLSALTADGSGLVQVSLVTRDKPQSVVAIQELVDAALGELIAGDRALATQTVEANAARLQEVEFELAGILDVIDVAPGTDLSDLYNRSTFGLKSATVQLANTTDSYWLERLPGDISVHQERVDSIDPILDEWYALTIEHGDLLDRVRPATERLRELEVGSAILASDVHHSETTVSAISKGTTLGRFIAGGVALGLGLGLGLTALGTVRRSR